VWSVAGYADLASSGSASRRANLPSQLTTFVGRQRERRLVEERLLQDSTRLLTLTGTGGVGKTRLALEVAGGLTDRFEHGVHFVALGPISDPAQVGWRIAQVLDVREVAGRPILDTIREYLRDRHLLLVVDNFEHLLEACPVLVDLLAACPRLKVLVTSRAPLHLHGEKEYLVPPLALPARDQAPSLPALAEVPAVALFLERAGDARPDFRLTEQDAWAVAETCRRLDGLPLAIELAAARIKLMPPPAMLARLERRLALLTGGPRDLPARHQTLRDAIAWSYELLSRSQRELFCRLAVFVGGFDLEAAEAVAGTLAADGKAVFDDLAALVDQSLVQPVQRAGGESGFLMLETIQEFALEQLELSGEARRLRRLHADYFLALAEEADPCFLRSEQLVWLARLDAEHANLVAALSWLAEQDDQAWARVGLLRLAGRLHWFWWFGGHVGEGRYWLDLALARQDQAEPAPADVRARAYQAAGGLAMVQAQYERAIEYFETAAQLYESLGNRREYGRCLTYRGLQYVFSGDQAPAWPCFERAVEIAREQDDTWGQALAGSNLAALIRGSDLTLSGDMLAMYAPLARETGDRYLLGATLPKWGSVSVALGDYQRGEALYREALSLFREMRDGWWTGRCLQLLGLTASETGRPLRAARLLGAAWARLESVGGQWMPYYHNRHAEAVDRARTALGSPAFERAWEQGQAMSAEQAVAEALEQATPTARTGGSPEPCPRSTGAERGRPGGLLTPREREVASLIAGGLSNRQIAARLVISERTAEAHVTNLLGKLGLRSRAQVAVWAVEQGLLPAGR
jgi:non-specific serine/threonine protein kinase